MRKIKHLINFLLHTGDTARIFAANHAAQRFGQCELLALDDFAVLNHADRDAVVDIAQHVEVYVDDVEHFEYIFLAHLAAVGVFDDGDRALQLGQAQNIVNLHGAPGGDMVEHDAVCDGV